MTFISALMRYLLVTIYSGYNEQVGPEKGPSLYDILTIFLSKPGFFLWKIYSESFVFLLEIGAEIVLKRM